MNIKREKKKEKALSKLHRVCGGYICLTTIKKSDNMHQTLLKIWYLATGMCYTHRLSDANIFHLLVLMLQIPTSLYILIKKLKCPPR